MRGYEEVFSWLYGYPNEIWSAYNRVSAGGIRAAWCAWSRAEPMAIRCMRTIAGMMYKSVQMRGAKARHERLGCSVAKREEGRGVARASMAPWLLLSTRIARQEGDMCRMCESFSVAAVVKSGASCVTGRQE